MMKKDQWKLALAARKRGGYRLLMWGVVFGLLVWWWLRVNRETEDEISPKHLQPSPPPSPARSTAPSRKDDLKRIEGVGPKIQNLLQEAGITTFGQLASADSKELEAILRGARLYMANPSTWPEQARLAAAGQWEALTELQAQLRGGKKQ